ncbi:MAG: phosphoribosylanthranilate isomerase [Rhodospirillaceae bacterium]|jgi:phosphoribosylanthranilate isomerase|nr:phosphoribosylanthranilate isomerase [Rhodospirillaceae bacterium]|tara:strand:- start:628 stop:1269 length:642 start_codon:yes stop_codon:yes gene_type:complete
MTIDVKICGLTDAAAIEAAVEGGAAMCGFVFFPVSPRNLTPEAAAKLTKGVPEGVIRVGLTVDADDALLAEIASVAGVDMLQLHGSETPERTAEVRDRLGLPVMKVLPVQGPDDLAAAEAYEGAADKLMFDAKPPEDATRPGGNARAFDWRLLRDRTFALPWLLAGGLTAENLAQAVKTSGAVAVDVSSGVEDAPGVKNADKIRAFLAAAAAL